MSMSVSNCDVQVIYGLPSKRHYEWLEMSDTHYLVVLDEKELSLPDHERIRFANSKDEEALKKIAWDFVFLDFDYEEKTACTRMAYFQEGIHLVASDFAKKGIDHLSNFLKNEDALKNARKAEDLFGAFPNTPAIICGAGPSLELEAPYLRNLKDRALIFGGGTALSSLSELGIHPHFAGMIDPHPPTSRYLKNQNLNVPALFQTRAHPDVVNQMNGPLLWAAGNENALFDLEHFDGGWNVSTFLVALACHFGCNPIILVGVDLAQTSDKPYSCGLERPEKGELIHVEKNLFTRRDWLFAADWLHEFALVHPEVEWINASQGLPIKGYKKSELRALCFEKQDDLFGHVHAAVQAARKGANTLLANTVKASFERIERLCISVLKLLEKIFPLPPEKNGEYALLQIELEKEEAYVHFLKPIWNIWKPVFERQMPEGMPKAYGIDLNAWLFYKGICDEAREI